MFFYVEDVAQNVFELFPLLVIHSNILCSFLLARSLSAPLLLKRVLSNLQELHNTSYSSSCPTLIKYSIISPDWRKILFINGSKNGISIDITQFILQ